VAVSKPKKKLKAKRTAVAPLDAPAIARAYFARLDGLEHGRVRERGDLLVIESGPADEPIPHARARRLATHVWQLEMATHTRWEPTPFRGPLPEILELLVESFPWILGPRE
jgi:hypothetical protein